MAVIRKSSSGSLLSVQAVEEQAELLVLLTNKSKLTDVSLQIQSFSPKVVIFRPSGTYFNSCSLKGAESGALNLSSD